MDYKAILNHLIDPIASCYFELPANTSEYPYIVVEGTMDKSAIWKGVFTLNLYHLSNDLVTPTQVQELEGCLYNDGNKWAHGGVNRVSQTISDELNVSLTKFNMILRGG